MAIDVSETAVSTGSADLVTGPAIITYVHNANAGTATLRDGGASGTIRLKVRTGGTVAPCCVQFTGNVHVDVADVSVGYVGNQ